MRREDTGHTTAIDVRVSEEDRKGERECGRALGTHLGTANAPSSNWPFAPETETVVGAEDVSNWTANVSEVR